MYTVTDLTELIRHHLVLSTDDTEKADVSLVQLMRNIEQMVTTPRWHEPITWHAKSAVPGCPASCSAPKVPGSARTAGSDVRSAASRTRRCDGLLRPGSSGPEQGPVAVQQTP